VGPPVSGDRSSVLADTNVVAIVGSDVTLNCSDSDSSSSSSLDKMRWNYVDYGRKTPITIYNGEKINTGIAICYLHTHTGFHLAFPFVMCVAARVSEMPQRRAANSMADYCIRPGLTVGMFEVFGWTTGLPTLGDRYFDH